MINLDEILHIDFETYSEVELNKEKSVGLWNYSCHPSTEVLVMAYKFGKGKVERWEPRLGPMSDRLVKAFKDPNQLIGSFNSTFERYILWHKLGIYIEAKRFIDPQVGARYLSMPGDLDEVSDILRLPVELAKDKRGKELIDLLSKRQEKRKKRNQPVEYYRNNWETHPAEWEEFCQYCEQDVIAEEEVLRREIILGAMPLPPLEQRIWEFDQRVNDRGIPVDVVFVKKALALAERAKEEALQKQNEITGLENANSPAQLTKWVKARGYPFSTLQKETIDSVLKDPEVKLTDDCRAVLKARREAASTSYTKLKAVLRQVSPDGKLRGQFIFMGSPRCGRWAGNAVQLHNMARPDKVFEDLNNVRAARELIMKEDYEGIRKRFGSVLLTVKYCIRTIFVANEVAA